MVEIHVHNPPLAAQTPIAEKLRATAHRLKARSRQPGTKPDGCTVGATIPNAHANRPQLSTLLRLSRHRQRCRPGVGTGQRSVAVTLATAPCACAIRPTDHGQPCANL
jgi:hypothetical protein